MSGKIFFCPFKKALSMGQEFVLLISASVFCVGACGFIIRKNPLIMFMSVELMLNSVNLSLIHISEPTRH